MALEFTTSYIEDSIHLLRYYKKLRGARHRASDGPAALRNCLDQDANSIAIVMQHMAGNMKSRWTNFLSEDGEKPWRNRDSEFEQPPATRAGSFADCGKRAGPACFRRLNPLTDADLSRTVPIRGEAHSVMQAINRQVAHYAYHCGQIVLLAKHFQHAQWTSLSVPQRQVARSSTRRCAQARPASDRHILRPVSARCITLLLRLHLA